MSAAKRLVSGSAATWMRMMITMVAQLLFVPVYLSYWNVSMYGIWLAVQALLSVFAIPDHGHQTFLEFEFMKLAEKNREKLTLSLWSGLAVNIGLGILIVAIVVLFLHIWPLQNLLGEQGSLQAVQLKEGGEVLVLLSVISVLTTSIGGLFVRALTPFGYFPRMSWWGVWAGIITAVAPVVAVMCGAGLLVTGIALGAASIAYNIPMFVDIFRLLRKENLLYQGLSIRLGWQNFSRSLVLSGKEFLENLRQQGVRVLLAPLSSAAGLTAFATMRTGSNIALQGLNTITNPIMPELMRFLHQKDQHRTEASFGAVWMVVIVFLAPGVLLIQAFIEPLYNLWTKGSIAFNPWLFALLSVGVLVYAVAQPAMAVMRGNNLLKPQIFISIISGITVVGGMALLVPLYGITGAGAALLLAEVLATTGYKIVAKKWLRQNGLQWPRQASLIATTSVWLAAALMAAMIQWPAIKWAALCAGLALLLINMYRYWLCLPELVIDRVKNFWGKLPWHPKRVAEV